MTAQVRAACSPEWGRVMGLAVWPLDRHRRAAESDVRRMVITGVAVFVIACVMMIIALLLINSVILTALGCDTQGSQRCSKLTHRLPREQISQ